MAYTETLWHHEVKHKSVKLSLRSSQEAGKGGAGENSQKASEKDEQKDCCIITDYADLKYTTVQIWNEIEHDPDYDKILKRGSRRGAW
jgi:hypothetical protein